MIKNNTKYIQIFFISLALYSLSKLVLRATGDAHPETFNVIVLFLSLSLTLGSKKTYYIITLPISIITALYAPIGLTYGYPSYQYVSSLLATDIEETFEFLTLLPYKPYIYAILIPLSFFILHSLACKFKIRPIKNRAYTLLVIVALTCSSDSLHFIKKASNSVNEFKANQAELIKYVNKNDWKHTQLKTNSKYDDYILIIGESARRDYFHVYGYPVDNTPFLDSTNGVVINGLTSGGTYTIGSLRMMLTQGDPNNWQPHYNKNIMGMVKQAGMESYWLSNQGQFGKWDSPISAIAKNAEHPYFTKFQDYDEYNIQDAALLQKLTKTLSSKTTKKRFIVIHTMGSHPNACDRIKNMKNQYKSKSKKYSYIACYISSIRQTDDFLKGVHRALKTSDNNRSFSMIYFSDHGLVHSEKDGRFILNNNFTSKYHHDIPLIKISSDDDTRIVATSRKSGLKFVDGLANWMGITSNSIPYYNLFDGIPDLQDYGLSKQVYKVDDPALDITYDLRSEN